MAASTLVTLTPVSPPGASISFGLKGDSTMQNATAGTGTSGFQIVDRPRQEAILQWYDQALYQITATLLIDSTLLYGEPGISVEQECLLMETWQQRVPGTTMPPVLAISGPVPGQNRQWAIYSLQWSNAIRDPQAGFRTQQSVKTVMYEYVAPTMQILNQPTPAAQAAAALSASTASQSYVLYTVSTGDTLSSIAASQLGNFSLWTTLATLNNIRTPNSLVAGEIIKIPQSL